MTTIALDATGGDSYPEPQIQGAIQALEENPQLAVVLVGPEEVIKQHLAAHNYPKERLLVVHAPEIIDMDESPTAALKTKQNSSIVVGTGMHKAGKAHAFVSAGNTGALLAAATFILGKLEGVIRPTIATPYPTYKGYRLLVDAGANLEMKRPEMYDQFGKMAAVYAEYVMGIENPRIGLINVGEEEEKGTEVMRNAYKLMRNNPQFVGNIEGRDILPCKADVYVSDGIVGNVLLKFGESVPDALKVLIGQSIKESGLSEEHMNIVLRTLKQALRLFDADDVGGIPFLGVNGVTLVGHGSTSAKAIKNLVLGAARCVEHNLNDKILEAIQ